MVQKLKQNLTIEPNTAEVFCFMLSVYILIYVCLLEIDIVQKLRIQDNPLLSSNMIFEK